jgi:hypothetical protein
MIRGSLPQTRVVLADEMRAQVGFHADARRPLLEDIPETQALDLPSEGDLSVSAEPNDSLPMSTPITVSGAVAVSAFGFMLLLLFAASSLQG